MAELQSILGSIDFLTQDSGFIATVEHGIQTLVGDPRFKRIVFKGFQNFIFSDGSHVNPKQMGQVLQTFCLQLFDRPPNAEAAIDLSSSQRRDPIVLKCLENVHGKIDSHLQDFCFEVLSRLLQLEDDTLEPRFHISRYISATLKLLKVLMASKPDVIAPVKKQMRTLQKMLEFVLTIYWLTGKKKLPFLEYIEPWLNSAAVVPFVFWVEEMDELLCDLFSCFLNKFYPTTSGLLEVYLASLKDFKPSEVSEILLMRKAVGCFLDIVLEDLILPVDDRFEMLSEGLTFLAAILIHPPQAYAEDEKLILRETNLLVNGAASWICKLWEDVAEGKNIVLHDLLEMIKRAKTELRRLPVEIVGNSLGENVPLTYGMGFFYSLLKPTASSWWKNVPRTNREGTYKLKPQTDLSWENVPQTNRKGFFDFLLENLKQKSEAEAYLLPFEKHQIAFIQKELVSLRPLFIEIFELQDKHSELKDVWNRASDVAYLVDYVTDLCLSVDVPIWSHLIHLSKAIDQIQFVKTAMAKIIKNQRYKDRVISAKINSKTSLPRREQANATIKDDVKMVFRLEEERIIDWLTRGEVKLDIAAIVGMPGQGKTTLAHRVFHNSSVKRCFDENLAWCCVSQAYDIKKILLDTLQGVGHPVPKEQVTSISKEDLAHQLYKCLKGRRYLVVLDDIWDVKAWNELKLSFPDDNNGSRILFTSRNSDVALKAKTDCFIIGLHPLSIEESWKLLKFKVFEEDFCPSTLSRIGRNIAENCKGLTLAIVLVASLLKKDKSVDSWDHISVSLNLQLASEGCMKVLELSYTHLPDFLKPCFLYLGAFQEDQIIDAEKLIQLWIAEGFVHKDGMKSLEIVAHEYLSNLVDSSLVIVAKRSSRNRIKKCRLHDLLHELAWNKAKEERFFLVPNPSWRSSMEPLNFFLEQNPSRTVCGAHRLYVPVDYVDDHFSGDFSCVRSILVSSGGRIFHPDLFVSSGTFELLRVLDLGYAYVDQSGFDKISQLIHLRFLSFAFEFISSSIVNLLRLEIFRFSVYDLPMCNVPKEMMKMGSIRQIFISSGFFKDDKELELYPPLINLETLTFLRFENASAFETLMRKLPSLRKLGIRLSFCARLSNYFNKLESLKLELSADISPSTFDFPSTLKELSLNAYRPLSGIMISSIGKLSNLEVLKLKARFKYGRWYVRDDEFLNLKYLKLSYSNVQDWDIESDESLRCLEQLVLQSCQQLRELPGTFGVISTLRRIEVRSCNKSVSSSFEQIVEDQRDNGNEDLHFSISYIDPEEIPLSF